MKRPLHRSNDRIIFGLCQGFATHFDLSVVWIRLGLVVTFVMTGFFPVVVIYCIAALVIKPETKTEIQENHEEDFYETNASARMLSLRRLKNKFDAIDARIRRMENHVTNKSYDWERRFKAGE